MASYTPDFAEVYLFRGRPLNNLASPAIPDDIRRAHLLEGGETRFYFSPVTISGSYLRDHIQGEYEEYASEASDVNLPYDIQIAGEYAWKSGAGHRIFDLSENTPHALYLGLNWLYGAFGMSAEFKDYQDFLLEFNYPPSLVKEHKYLLLNRSTHRLIALDERGWQTEFFYRFENESGLNVNWAESVNNLYDNRYVFSEKFAELSYQLAENYDLKVFVDDGIESLFDIRDRYTAGRKRSIFSNATIGTELSQPVQSRNTHQFPVTQQPKSDVANL